MARLPDPIIDKVPVEWPEKSEYGKREMDFNNTIAIAIVKAIKKSKAEKKGKDEE